MKALHALSTAIPSTLAGEFHELGSNHLYPHVREQKASEFPASLHLVATSHLDNFPVLRGLARNPHADADLLAALSRVKDAATVLEVAANPMTSEQTLQGILRRNRKDTAIWLALAMNPSTGPTEIARVRRYKRAWNQLGNEWAIGRENGVQQPHDLIEAVDAAMQAFRAIARS